MSLFAISLPYLREWIARGVRSVTVVNNGKVVAEPPMMPLNMAYDATLEELQLQNAQLRLRLHWTKQHNKAVTRQLLDLSQQHAALQTECSQAKAEANYWHARCGKHSSEAGDVVQPPFTD